MTGNELFLLMLNLSQITDDDHIKRIFIEAMNSSYHDLDFSFTNDKKSDCGENIEVATTSRSYGCVVLEGNLDVYSSKDLSLIRNSIGLLAIILENRLQAQTLEKKNIDLEKSVQENRVLIEKIAKTAPVMIYVYDLEKRINLYSNMEIESILGYSPETLMKMGEGFLYDIIHDDDKELIQKHHERMGFVDFHEVHGVEYRMKGEDGTWHWLLSRDAPYQKDASGKTVTIVGCAMDITERMEATEYIKKSLHEKEVLLKEVHHRVKNNLQIVSSLLSLQLDQMQNENDKNVFRDFQNRVKAMALVHESLYQSDDFSGIMFKDYMDLFTSKLLYSFNSDKNDITFNMDIENAHINLNQAIPCSLIINELMTNSLKHAFKGKNSGIIDIRFYSEKDEHVLIYKDNGIGLPDNFDFKTSETLGMELIRSLTAQLRGKVSFSDKKGVTYNIIFPRE